MTKYKQYFLKMMETEKEIFDSFKKIHAEYDFSRDKDSLQDKFNQEGEKVLKIIREWESKLCSQSEKAGYGSYTGSLAEKFQAEVRKEFPLIDYVGVIVRPFTIKKIKLSS